jgi:hypothetical protein
MAYDKHATFFDGDEAITDSAVTSLAVELGETHANTDIYIDCRVTEAFNAGTSIAISLITSAAVGLGTPTTLFTTAAIATSSLVLGYKFKIGTIPQGALKYIGLVATPVGTFDAGHLFAAIAENITSDTFAPLSPPTGSRY